VLAIVRLGASAAEVIEQMKNDAARLRAAATCLLPPRPGDDTLVLVDRPPARRLEDDGRAGLAHGPRARRDVSRAARSVRRGRHDSGPVRAGQRAYVGCGVLASSVGMDKAVMRTLFRARHLPVADWSS
jgi:hypothetical protein